MLTNDQSSFLSKSDEIVDRNTDFVKINMSQDKDVGSGMSIIAKLENAIQNGAVVLMYDIGEQLDPSLNTLFAKQTFMEDSILKINISGDKPIEYVEGFRLFICTRLGNPHFSPETYIKLSVINFTVTFQGLEDQMLVDVVAALDA